MAGKVMAAKGTDRRYHVLSFRVTAEELLLIKRARRSRKLSKFLRMTILSALPAPLQAGAAASDQVAGGCNG